MANSCSKIIPGSEPWTLSPRTSGPLGWNDAGAPFADLDGDTPGSLGVNDHAVAYMPLVLNLQGVVQRIFKQGKDLTKECEGNKGTPYWPKGASGITIGYGYDMKERSAFEVANHLINSGAAPDLAKLLSTGAGLSQATPVKAHDHLASEVNYRGVVMRYQQLEIDQMVRDKLFEIVYTFYESNVAKICAKPKVVAKFGSVNWTALHPAIKAVLIDLRFRGDYHGKSRNYLQSSVAANDPKEFVRQLRLFLKAHQHDYDPGIRRRFEKRIEFAARYGGIPLN